MTKIYCVSVFSCMPVIGNVICAQMMSISRCLVHFVNLCIQLNCGGIILYIASTDYMYVTMCLDDYSDYPNTVVHRECLRRDWLLTVKQSYETLYINSCHV